MRLGVVPLLSGDSGGVYQYCLSILSALRKPGVLAPQDRVTIFLHNPNDVLPADVQDNDWTIMPLSPPSLRPRLVGLLRRLNVLASARKLLRSRKPEQSRIPEDIDQIRYNGKLNAWFRKAGIDLMLYPVPMSVSFECGIPYIFTVHDLQHRLQPEFPEVGEPSEWKAREYLFRNGVKHAQIVIADSPVGCEDVLDCYSETGITKDRVRHLPFVPPSYLPGRVSSADRQAVRDKYGLPSQYFFYPAQFWPHKNHARLVEALSILRSEHSVKASLVLCGSHNNAIRSKTYTEVMELIDRFDLKGQIHYLGFVPDQEIAALYAEARALVMPTFFGPTNIPILEAWSLGCPVLTSDIRGVRDQAQDAALLVDPTSTKDVANGLYRLWIDDELCKKLRKNGEHRLSVYGAGDFAERLSQILELAKHKLGG